MEKKIQILHKDINDMNMNIKQLKLHWIQQQNNIVTLSDKREKQLHVIQLLKKRNFLDLYVSRGIIKKNYVDSIANEIEY